jgi:hypothetical protein
MINRESVGEGLVAEVQTAPGEYPTYNIDGITQNMTAAERAKWDEALAAGNPPRTEELLFLERKHQSRSQAPMVNRSFRGVFTTAQKN